MDRRTIQAGIFKRKWLLFSIIFVILIAVGTFLVTRQISDKQNQRLNIVFVLTDDQSLDLMPYMPKTNKLLAGEGMSFSNYFDNISLCCAARVSIMRGQYAHNSKVEDNELPNGGFGKFYQLGEHNDNLSTWLRDAGYDTSLMGKYLNGYPNSRHIDDAVSVPQTYVPPGWSDWFSPVAGGPYSEYNYTMNDNGTLKKYGKDADDYMVDAISKRANDYITARKDSTKPYFMYVAPYAPHAPYTPAPRHKGSESQTNYPRTPAFNEADVSDKPADVSSKPELTTKQKRRITKRFRQRAEAVKGVDDLVAGMYDTLKKTGQLDNTYFVFTSDNGYHMGEHRLAIGKYTPYETDIHLPLFVRGPGIKAGSGSNDLSGNIDLAQTFAAMAGAKVPSYADGRSLLPSLQGTATASRDYYLLERLPSTFTGGDPNAAGSSPEEPADPSLSDRVGNAIPPPYTGLRSRDGFVYIQYRSGEEEFYDLTKDKYQLNNLLSSAASPKLSAAQQSKLQDMRTNLPKLANCQGAACSR